MGLTQAEPADQCGVKRNTISRYERGKQRPERAPLIRLMEITGLSSDALLFPDRYLEQHPLDMVEYASDETKRGRPPRST
jgi:transcriptional regulator with XRE-family HTH domain